jgi:hypothetical protein
VTVPATAPARFIERPSLRFPVRLGERRPGSATAPVVCMLQGAWVGRVHDAPATVDAARMIDLLRESHARARAPQDLPEERLR